MSAREPGRGPIGRLVLASLALWLAVVGCQVGRPSAIATSDTPTLRIVATDTGHDAPDSVVPGLRHIRFVNRGTQIHEALIIR